MNTNSKVLKHRQALGMSLVELLIAMTIGLVLLAGMLMVFSGNKRSADLNTAMANIQENARFALSELSNDVRLASYQGCLDSRRGSMIVKAADAPVPQTGIQANGTPIHNFNLSAITGAIVDTADSWQPPIPGGFVPPGINEAIPGTHVLAVQYGHQDQSTLTGPVATGGVPSFSGPITTTRNLQLSVGDLAIISNCVSVDLFEVTGASPAPGGGQTLLHAAPGNIDGNLTSRYGIPRNIADTRVKRFMSNVYYIGDTGLQNETGDQIRALYQQSWPYNDPSNPPTEVVQGVENMRLSFGVRNGNTIRYVTANDPLFQPADIESVQIGLIMSSWDRIAEQDDTNTYIVAGQPVPASTNSVDGTTHAEDGRYRLVFNTTVKVRNRRDERIFMSQQ